ncbi:MAG: sodium:proton antiporter [Gammaproteobacteria bacterium SG8_11]|nr:MAG: sodium:proton antiporter [Gammaproteobacteria bacterium SG8_11]
MGNENIIYTIFLIFTGAAVLATVGLYARQSLLVVYILLGILFGPSGAKWVTDPVVIKQISHVGIIFLLFLLGMNLPAKKLIHLVKQTTLITGVSSLLFGMLGFGIALLFAFSTTESIVIGTAMMFSSTIIGLKLLPTTVLHHRHTGELIISILLLQDLLAIMVLLFLQAANQGQWPLSELAMLTVYFAVVALFTYVLQRYVLLKLISQFDKIQEYLFLVTIGWCLGVAEFAHQLGLSYEIGAFLAGVALAANPISLYISEVLKPLRDFFLILFFFSVGATFDLGLAQDIMLPAVLLGSMILAVKPLAFKYLLINAGEDSKVSAEIGVRLGQGSEFSLLIAVLALDMAVIGEQAAYLIQVSTLLTFIASSYFIVLRYPTPVAVSDKLRRD